MTQVDATSQLWAEMSLSYNPDDEAEPPPNTFAIMGQVLHFYKSYNYKICEWRPGHYAVASVMGNWSIPVFCDQLVNLELYEHMSSRLSQPISVIGEEDIFLLIGLCTSWH